jgi:hypothetical protein
MHSTCTRRRRRRSLCDVRSPWKSGEKNPKDPNSQTPKITTYMTHKTQATERYEKEKCERELRERERESFVQTSIRILV